MEANIEYYTHSCTQLHKENENTKNTHQFANIQTSQKMREREVSQKIQNGDIIEVKYETEIDRKSRVTLL